jgi:hypothetical protein
VAGSIRRQLGLRARQGSRVDPQGCGEACSTLGFGATGKPFSVEGIDVVAIDDDGRFTEHYGLFDVPAMMQQLGLMPGPG